MPETATKPPINTKRVLIESAKTTGNRELLHHLVRHENPDVRGAAIMNPRIRYSSLRLAAREETDHDLRTLAEDGKHFKATKWIEEGVALAAIAAMVWVNINHMGRAIQFAADFVCGSTAAYMGMLMYAAQKHIYTFRAWGEHRAARRKAKKEKRENKIAERQKEKMVPIQRREALTAALTTPHIYATPKQHELREAHISAAAMLSRDFESIERGIEEHARRSVRAAEQELKRREMQIKERYG